MSNCILHVFAVIPELNVAMLVLDLHVLIWYGRVETKNRLARATIPCFAAARPRDGPTHDVPKAPRFFRSSKQEAAADLLLTGLFSRFAKASMRCIE